MKKDTGCPTFYKAKFDSYNFIFTSYGETKQKAIEKLKEGLIQHSRDFGIDQDWWIEYKNDIYVIEVGLGGCYRDNEAILEHP
jgi:hypothetical protein